MTAEQDVLIAFVLDKSGSMAGLTGATIEGFNQFLTEQKAQPGNPRMSLTLFDTGFDARFVARPLSEIPEMSTGGTNPYRPGGGTALMDALGVTIKGTEQWLANHPEFSGRVLVATWTDGEENSSREWHINIPMVEGDDRDLNGLIAWKQQEGWEFVFLGTGGSGWLENAFGSVVDASRFYSTASTPAGQSSSFAGLSNATTSYRSALRSSGATGQSVGDWEIDPTKLVN